MILYFQLIQEFQCLFNRLSCVISEGNTGIAVIKTDGEGSNIGAQLFEIVAVKSGDGFIKALVFFCLKLALARFKYAGGMAYAYIRLAFQLFMEFRVTVPQVGYIGKIAQLSGMYTLACKA